MAGLVLSAVRRTGEDKPPKGAPVEGIEAVRCKRKTIRAALLDPFVRSKTFY
jgi:hypothetical protein